MIGKNLEKLAYKKLDEVDPRYLYLHVIALGAGEYYGPNSNGDYFPESELLPACKKLTDGSVRCYGYDTFKSHAKVFRLHQNKDPQKAIGHVIDARYNQKMHRVELILAVDKEKAPDIVERVESGDKPPVSMGCRVEYDKCSICDNVAYKSRAEYCEHGRFMLGKLLPDGRMVYRINIAPIFHDISFVRVPADKTAYVLQKVASDLKTAEISKREPSLGEVIRIDELVRAILRAIGNGEKVDPKFVAEILDLILKNEEAQKLADAVLEDWELGKIASDWKQKALPILVAALAAQLLLMKIREADSKLYANTPAQYVQDGKISIQYPYVYVYS